MTPADPRPGRQAPGRADIRIPGWPTTRRHPRSLSEAFSDVRASCVSEWSRPNRLTDAVIDALAAVAFGALIGALLIYSA